MWKADPPKRWTHTYSTRENVGAFYNITADVLCYGEDVFGTEWPMDGSRFTYSFSTTESNKRSSDEKTCGARYLAVILKDGTTIDSWKYNALAGHFFEYGGICTRPLSEDELQTLNEVFELK